MIPNSGSPDFQIRALAQIAEEKMTQFLKLMDRWETVDWKTVKHINATAVWISKDRMKITDTIRKYSDPLEDKRPSDIPGLDDLLYEAVPNTFKMIGSPTGPGPAAIGSIIFETSSVIDDWQYYNPDLLILGYNEGNFGRWSGPPRKGKTNGAGVLIERWIKQNRIAITNIAKKEETNDFIYAGDARGLFETLCTIPRQTKMIFINDEGGLTDSKLHASTLHARYMNDVYRVWGKFWGNALYIDQLYSKCPEVIESFSTNIYHSIEPGTVYFELSGKIEFRRVLTGFPLTNLPYDTRDIAYFDSKTLNVEGLLSAISGITDEKAKFDAMHDYLESPASHPKRESK